MVKNYLIYNVSLIILTFFYLFHSHFAGSISEEEKIQVVLNSEGPDKNVVIYSGEPTVGKNGSEWTTYKCRVCHMWMFAVHNIN